MPTRWKLFRLLCILQMILAGLALLETVFSFFIHANWAALAKMLAFVAILFLASLGLTLINQNYPDEPIEGNQRKSFNRLFLLNFLLLSFLFGFVIVEYRFLGELAELTGRNWLSFSVRFYFGITSYFLLLIFQMLVLYGLYALRIELAKNFRQRKFDFETS